VREFVSEEIEVHFAKKPGPPSSFTWRGAEYKITEIAGSTRKLDFRSRWWRRRHRDYYVVRTDTGETFRIYFHRGFGRKYWVLYAKLDE
jgi:hypothetical protein